MNCEKLSFELDAMRKIRNRGARSDTSELDSAKDNFIVYDFSDWGGFADIMSHVVLSGREHAKITRVTVFSVLCVTFSSNVKAGANKKT